MKKVLLVDDSKDWTRPVEEYLQLQGHDTRTAKNSQGALKHYKMIRQLEARNAWPRSYCVLSSAEEVKGWKNADTDAFCPKSDGMKKLGKILEAEQNV